MRSLLAAAVTATLALSLCTRAAPADPPREQATDLERDLLARWPLAGDALDQSEHARHAGPHGNINWQTAAGRKSAAFNGRDAWLEVPPEKVPSIGTGDFTLTAWINVPAALDDVPGDILAWYDPKLSRGFHLTLKTNAGVTTTQANYRQLQFAIDNDRSSDWVDCGRPGNAVLAFALAVHDGQLWAGTCEPGLDASGRVYRYGGASEWIDSGAPDKSNSVTALAAFDGKLYAGTGKYRLRGSALEESANEHPGGRVFRYDQAKWTDCGQLPGVEAVGGMAVFRGRLYASSLYRPAGFFRYEGGSKWTTLAVPEKRVEALGVFDGFLYATSYDGGRVYRFDGQHWTDCGQLGDSADNTQTYSFAVHHGRLFVGTWRSGRVYRFEDLDRWTDAGRLGEELEVMGMLVHNGRLIAGTLPLAEVYAYDGDTDWRRLARLDLTPGVQYRRAWTMAEYQGRLFTSTLPSGHVYSFQAGTAATWDHEFPAGWHHVAAVKSDGRLRLFVDGRAVAQSRQFDPAAYDLNHAGPLTIGFGANDRFCGSLADVRYYGRALAEDEVRRLAEEN